MHFRGMLQSRLDNNYQTFVSLHRVLTTGSKTLEQDLEQHNMVADLNSSNLTANINTSQVAKTCTGYATIFSYKGIREMTRRRYTNVGQWQGIEVTIIGLPF